MLWMTRVIVPGPQCTRSSAPPQGDDDDDGVEDDLEDDDDDDDDELGVEEVLAALQSVRQLLR